MTERPRPKISPESRRYWEAAKEGKLVFQFCVDCRRGIFPPRVACPYCLTEDLTWRESTGRGEVYTYSIIHEPSIEWFEERAPYVIALIELEEAVYVFGNVIGCDTGEVAIGMPVEVSFEQFDDELSLPQFVSG